jgi:hypothetical protein
MNYIYETPWWLPAGIAILGLILFITGNNRVEKKLRLAGIIVIVLGIALAVTSYLLDSEREKVVKRTRALVKSVEKRDWNAMGTYLHPNVTIAVLSGRDTVVGAARSAADYSDIREIRITGIDANQNPDETFRTSIRVYAALREGNNITDWDLEWEKDGDVWLARNIVPRGGPGITGTMLEDYIRSRGK